MSPRNPINPVSAKRDSYTDPHRPALTRSMSASTHGHMESPNLAEQGSERTLCCTPHLHPSSKLAYCRASFSLAQLALKHQEALAKAAISG